MIAQEHYNLLRYIYQPEPIPHCYQQPTPVLLSPYSLFWPLGPPIFYASTLLLGTNDLLLMRLISRATPFCIRASCFELRSRCFTDPTRALTQALSGQAPSLHRGGGNDAQYGGGNHRIITSERQSIRGYLITT